MLASSWPMNAPTQTVRKSEKELEWISLRPELVVEVTFDHASDGRIRHGTKILRWRDDKAPRDCALAQMQS